MNQQDLTTAFVTMAREAGADLVGVAAIDRFAGVPEDRHPQSIFPETACVVVLGKRITRGALRGIETGTQMEIYRQYANNWVPHQFMSETTVAAASFLEDRGWEAVPLPDLPPETPVMGVPVAPGLPAPNVMLDFIDAAVRAGLGTLSRMGELLTPEFGHRQRLQVILTDAPLASSPLFEGDFCDGCDACARACPLQAVDLANEQVVEIAGRNHRVAKVDDALCRRCGNGAAPNPYHSAGRTDRLAAACHRACMLSLEERGLLKTAFVNRFRQAPAWTMDLRGNLAVEER